jgi:hypothetical protein
MRDKETKERMRQLASERRESMADLANSLGLNVKSLQVVMSDPNKLISINMIRACVGIGVNANWLMTGEGEMLIAQINESIIHELESEITRKRDLIESLEGILLKK